MGQKDRRDIKAFIKMFRRRKNMRYEMVGERTDTNAFKLRIRWKKKWNISWSKSSICSDIYRYKALCILKHLLVTAFRNHHLLTLFSPSLPQKCCCIFINLQCKIFISFLLYYLLCISPQDQVLAAGQKKNNKTCERKRSRN